MNTSYNYADFIGLNLDSNNDDKSAHHPLHDKQTPTEKAVVKSVNPATTQTKNRITP